MKIFCINSMFNFPHSNLVFCYNRNDKFSFRTLSQQIFFLSQIDKFAVKAENATES